MLVLLVVFGKLLSAVPISDVTVVKTSRASFGEPPTCKCTPQHTYVLGGRRQVVL